MQSLSLTSKDTVSDSVSSHQGVRSSAICSLLIRSIFALIFQEELKYAEHYFVFKCQWHLPAKELRIEHGFCLRVTVHKAGAKGAKEDSNKGLAISECWNRLVTGNQTGIKSHCFYHVSIDELSLPQLELLFPKIASQMETLKIHFKCTAESWVCLVVLFLPYVP